MLPERYDWFNPPPSVLSKTACWNEGSSEIMNRVSSFPSHLFSCPPSAFCPPVHRCWRSQNSWSNYTHQTRSGPSSGGGEWIICKLLLVLGCLDDGIAKRKQHLLALTFLLWTSSRHLYLRSFMENFLCGAQKHHPSLNEILTTGHVIHSSDSAWLNKFPYVEFFY